jgi:LDH2 family malate/lactate/ureidoglycolate dehydrogenase
VLGELRAIPPAPGFDEVLAPGDPEQRAQGARERDGVPIEPALWGTLNELSRELEVPVPAAR